MKNRLIDGLVGLTCGFIIGLGIGGMIERRLAIKQSEPTPEPFQLETVQLQRGNTLITVCIDKRTQQAVPCTAYFLPL